MKKLLIFILLLTLLLPSCKKEESNDDPLPDQILYRDIEPDVVMNSINYLYEHPSGCGLVPSPADSTAEYQLDMDLDGINDFKITVKTTYEFVSASGPCANYQYRMYIESLKSSEYISYQPNNYYNGNFLVAGDSINSKLLYHTSAMFHLVAPLAPYFTFSGDKYLPVKLVSGSKTMYGWIRIERYGLNSITLKEFALNITSNNPIIAGQKE